MLITHVTNTTVIARYTPISMYTIIRYRQVDRLIKSTEYIGTEIDVNNEVDIGIQVYMITRYIDKLIDRQQIDKLIQIVDRQINRQIGIYI